MEGVGSNHWRMESVSASSFDSVGEHSCWSVELEILRAHDLPRTDVVGHCDPYVIVLAGSVQYYRSATCYSTANPEWSEQLWLEQVATGTAIELQVYDRDFVTEDDVLGACTYVFEPSAVAQPADASRQEFGRPPPRQTTLLELPLLGPKGALAYSGAVSLQVRCWPSAGAGRSMPGLGPILRGPATYRTSVSALAGALTGATDDDGWLAFAAHTVQLVGVPTYLRRGRDEQHWNTRYAKARKIFANPAAMAAVRAQHALLYAENGRADLRGQLRTGEDFVALLRYGVRSGERRYYTYALCTDGSLRFSETGAAFFSDFMSKHAMHSDCAETVLYAGEFCLVPADVDIDSGSSTSNNGQAGGAGNSSNSCLLHGSRASGACWALQGSAVGGVSTAAEPQPFGTGGRQLRTAGGRHRLVIDNNSGTYAPDKALLPAVRDLLQYNLQGLEVVCVSADDPLLLRYHALVPSRCTPQTAAGATADRPRTALAAAGAGAAAQPGGGWLSLPGSLAARMRFGRLLPSLGCC